MQTRKLYGDHLIRVVIVVVVVVAAVPIIVVVVAVVLCTSPRVPRFTELSKLPT